MRRLGTGLADLPTVNKNDVDQLLTSVKTYVTIKADPSFPAPERAWEPSSPKLAQGNEGKFNFRRTVCKLIQYITVCALLLYYIE